MTIKPHLACDFDEEKQKFPCIGMAKVDGVRGINLTGILTGRSLKCHANKFTTALYSKPEYIGFDGELAADLETHPDLCRLTTSALNTIVGEPFTLWWLFDYVTPETESLPYMARLNLLSAKVHDLLHKGLAGCLRLIPWKLLRNMEEFLAFEDECLEAGYEGVIVRDPDAPHKSGRCTVREGAYLRVKRFIEVDAKVLSLAQGQTNNNEQQVNELGNSFRSTHAENMAPNGQVGSMECELLEDVYDRKKLLFTKGQIVTVSPGKMPVADRKKYWENPELLVEQTIKFKLFPKGTKDKPRFPVFVSLRAPSDKV